MAEYIKTVLIAGIAGALTVFMCPEGEGGSGKYVKFISSFVILLVILSPLRNVSSFVSSVKRGVENIMSFEGEDVPQADYVPAVELTAENISDYIMYLCEKDFGIDRESMKVRLVLNEDDLRNVEITEIQVYTGIKTGAERDNIRLRLEDILECKVFVLGP